MKTNRLVTPDGTRDLLFEECAVRRRTEDILTGLFRSYGFGEVMTPGLEFLDVFTTDAAGRGHAALPMESMYKLTDTAGRLLVLRPDATLPIARLVCARLSGAPLPLRLYYAQDVWRWGSGLSGHDSQQFQAGVELVGITGEKADLEILALAVESLRLCLGRAARFRMEIGHAAFFNALFSELEAEAGTDRVEGLRDLIEAKNYTALGSRLDALPDTAAVRAVRQLPRLFGGGEVLNAAAAYCHTPEARAALDELEALYGRLCALGLGGKILLDLGLVHRHEYYTGVIFRGYAEGSGDTVISGGRYDTLLRQYGRDLPATGFGVDVDALARILLAAGEGGSSPAPSILVHAAPGNEAVALLRMAELTAGGASCEHSVFATEEEARQYAAQKGIASLDVV